jgi:hypothetical protein
VLWPNIGHVGPTCQAGQPCNLARWLSFLLAPPLALDTLRTTSAGHVAKTVFGNAPTHGRPAIPWLGGARALCHIIPSCHLVCDYALFWT